MSYLRKALIVTAGLLALWAETGLGLTSAQKCRAAKLKITAKYAYCLLKADAKAVLTTQLANYSKCIATFTGRFSDAEGAAGGLCPTRNDVDAVEARVLGDAARFKQFQARWVDNLDGTVSDTLTGLIWEQKDNLDGGANFANPHDADNSYSWGGPSPSGTAFTDFLARLNNGTTSSPTGGPISGCFAGYCDWRLPTSAELQSIRDFSAVGCETGNPCIDAVFGPTVASHYWTSLTLSSDPLGAWAITFGPPSGFVYVENKGANLYVRAVRSGS